MGVAGSSVWGGGRGWGQGPRTALTRSGKERHRDPRARPYSRPCSDGGRRASPKMGGQRASSSGHPPLPHGDRWPTGPTTLPRPGWFLFLPTPQIPYPCPKARPAGCSEKWMVLMLLPRTPHFRRPPSPLLGESGPIIPTFWTAVCLQVKHPESSPSPSKPPPSGSQGRGGGPQGGDTGGRRLAGISDEPCGTPGPAQQRHSWVCESNRI